MNRDEITRKTSELSTIAHTTEDSKVEYWYARELMTYMGYDRWENFSKAITRAKQACDNSGVSVESHFRDTTRDVTLGSGATRSIADVKLTRYACYLIAQTVIQRKKKWHFSRAILPFRLAKRKSLSNAWEKSAGSPAERPLPLQRRNSIRIPKSHTTKPHKSTCTRPTTPQNAGKDVIQATESVVPPRQCNNCPLCSEGRWWHGCHPKEGV